MSLSDQLRFLFVELDTTQQLITTRQVDCHIWKKKCERVEPVGKGVEYAYQVRYWKKLPKPKKVTPPPPPDVPADPEEVYMGYIEGHFNII